MPKYDRVAHVYPLPNICFEVEKGRIKGFSSSSILRIMSNVKRITLKLEHRLVSYH